MREALGVHAELVLVKPNLLAGSMDLDAVFSGIRIRDRFEIEIEATREYPGVAPVVRETGGRIDAIKTRFGVTDPLGLHRNSDGTCCLCAKPEIIRRWRPGTGVLAFIDSLLIPYLFGVSFFQAEGRWPWPERSHGVLGLLEYFHESQSIAREDAQILSDAADAQGVLSVLLAALVETSMQPPCLCGSARPFSKCHHTAWSGLQRIGPAFQNARSH